MSDCLTATNGVNNVRKLQRARYRPSKQDKKNRLYSLYDKVWRADVLWEAWRLNPGLRLKGPFRLGAPTGG